jgi:hypothetical protein
MWHIWQSPLAHRAVTDGSDMPMVEEKIGVVNESSFPEIFYFAKYRALCEIFVRIFERFCLISRCRYGGTPITNVGKGLTSEITVPYT